MAGKRELGEFFGDNREAGVPGNAYEYCESKKFNYYDKYMNNQFFH